MAAHEAARRQAHRHRREHHRQQGGQPEKTLRLIKRPVHLGARIFHAFHVLAALQAGCRPAFKGFHFLERAGHVQAPRGATAGRDQPGILKIVDIEQRARQKTEKVRAAIRFEGDHAADTEGEPAQRDLIAVEARLQTLLCVKG